MGRRKLLFSFSSSRHIRCKRPKWWNWEFDRETVKKMRSFYLQYPENMGMRVVSCGFPVVKGVIRSQYAIDFHLGLIWGLCLVDMPIICRDFGGNLPFTGNLQEVSGLLYPTSTEIRDIHFYSRIVHFKNGAKQCYQLKNNEVLNMLHIKVTSFSLFPHFN